MTQHSYTGLPSDEWQELQLRIQRFDDNHAGEERFCESVHTGEKRSMADVLESIAEDSVYVTEYGVITRAAKYIRRLEKENAALRAKLATKGAKDGSV
jgi:hypothetical protein